MRTQVEFRSDAFRAYPGEEEEINPGRWGKRLAEFIASELPRHGIAVLEMYAEDWGWEIALKNEAFPIYIGCGNQEDQDGKVFLCFINPSKPVIRKRFFKKVSTVVDIERITTALDQILRSHPDIQNLQWR